MLVLHIRDLLFRFIGIIVDLCLFIGLIRLIHITLSRTPVAITLYMLLILLHLRLLLLLVLILPGRGFLTLLARILVLLIALLGLRLFIFLLVHVTHF